MAKGVLIGEKTDTKKVTMDVPDLGAPKPALVALATVVPGSAAQGVAAHFFECYVHTLQGGWAFPMIATSGVTIYKARNQLCADMLQSPATHILFVDSDQIWDRDVMKAFADRAHAQKLDVVSGIVNRLEERPDGQHVAYPSIYGEDRNPLPKPEGGGLQEVGAVGAGALLISKRLLVSMRGKWFSPEFRDEDGTILGEDLSFCKKVRASGIKIYADWDFPLGHLKQLAI